MELERDMEDYFEKVALWEKMNAEIERIVGLDEIKQQVIEITHQIKDAELQTILGRSVLPPKPIHMAFIGKSGTGKSFVAEVIGKALFLAGSLHFYTVVERLMFDDILKKIDAALGEILLITVDDLESDLEQEVSSALISLMDEGDTSVIFAGEDDNINRLMNSNKPLYERLSKVLRFPNLTRRDITKIIRFRFADESSISEDNFMHGLKLDEACSNEEIQDILEREVSDEVMEMLHGFLVDPILISAKKILERRLDIQRRLEGVDAEPDNVTTITLQDLEFGVRYVQSDYATIFD